MTGQRPVSTADGGGRWWISDGPVDHDPPGEKILGPFASRDLALEVRALYEAHPRANGMTYWVSQEPRRHLTAVPPRAGDDLRETCKAVLAEHVWMRDGLVCACDPLGQAIGISDHRAHVADALAHALTDDGSGLGVEG